MPRLPFFTALFVIVFTCSLPQGEPFAQSANFRYASAGFSPGAAYSRPLGIFFDQVKNECYVADTGNHQVVVCNENGFPVYHFSHFIGDGEKRVPGEPKGIAVDSRGRIFLTDAAASYIDVLDYRGKSIKHIYPSSTQDRFDCLALGPGDKVYASLSGAEKIVTIIDSDLNILREVKLEPLEDERPFISGLAVDKNGKIYITNSGARVMVQIYDANGKYIRGFGYHNTGFENFSFPSGIAVMDNGNIWVADALRQVVSCFSAEGGFIFFVGGKGAGPGSFNYPSAVTTDGKNRLFVLERIGNRYQCFQLTENASSIITSKTNVSTTPLLEKD